MSSRTLLCVLPLFVFAWRQDEREPDPLAVDRDLATLVPENALVYAEAPGVAALLTRGLEHPLVKTLLASEFGALIARELGRPPAEALKQLDEFTGLAVLPTVASLGERGFALGVTYDHGEPLSLLIARGADAQKQRETLERVLEAGATKAGFPGAFEEPGDEMLGADVWYVGEELKVALRDAVVFAANDGKLLRAALDLAAHADARGLASTESFARAASSRDPRHFAWAWAGLDDLAAREHGDGVRKLRDMLTQPGAQFVLGPGMSALGCGDALTLSIDLEREDVSLELRASGVEPGAAKAVMPVAGGNVIELAPHANDVASLVAYRDGAGLFAHRVELFPADQLPGFAKALSDLAPFFGGRDLGESVLSHVAPWMRVVARPVVFDAQAQPEIPLPAVAAVLEIDQPDEFGPVLLGAFQSGVGLVNIDRGQKGLDSLLMRLELVGDVQMTSARFTPPHAGDGVDVRYNLVPACALVGRAFVVGTHAGLVADLARELRSAQESVAVSSESLRISGRSVADVVRANLDALVAQAVLDEGKTREQSEGELRAVIGLLELVGTAELRVEYPSASEIRVAAKLDLVAARD